MKVTEILTDLMAEKEVSEEKEDAALIPSYEGKVNKERHFCKIRKSLKLPIYFQRSAEKQKVRSKDG